MQRGKTLGGRLGAAVALGRLPGRDHSLEVAREQGLEVVLRVELAHIGQACQLQGHGWRSSGACRATKRSAASGSNCGGVSTAARRMYGEPSVAKRCMIQRSRSSKRALTSSR